MTLAEALISGIEVLKSSDIDAPAVEAGVILCFVTGRDKSYLYSHGDHILSDGELNLFNSCINKRAEGMPVQYITGRQEFMSLALSVNPGVLIPRQDTEILAETVIEHLKHHNDKETLVLDIGTGSGCIAISIAYYLKQCRVVASDISEKALETAHSNANCLNVAHRMEFVRSDLFSGLGNFSQSFDVIVSNPPYIPTDEVKTLQTEVKDYEPLTALDGGKDGLDFYKSIIGNSVRFLKPGGMLAFEIGYGQAGQVKELLAKDFHDIRIIRDLAKTERVVTGLSA